MRKRTMATVPQMHGVSKPMMPQGARNGNCIADVTGYEDDTTLA